MLCGEGKMGGLWRRAAISFSLAAVLVTSAAASELFDACAEAAASKYEPGYEGVGPVGAGSFNSYDAIDACKKWGKLPGIYTPQLGWAEMMGSASFVPNTPGIPLWYVGRRGYNNDASDSDYTKVSADGRGKRAERRCHALCCRAVCWAPCSVLTC